MDNDIAVTVIGGYLGAGKTTLVNHILRTADERVAVLVNDFGDINIDADLIESQDGDTISLANGCICCSLVDGFAAALATVRQLDPVPGRLVIEASGVADPATVAAYGHGPGLALDAVVVVADGETVRQRSTDRYVGDTVLAQLRSADVLVLNKIDLIEPDAVAAITAWLAQAAPAALIVGASQAIVAPEVLFGTTPTGHGAGRVGTDQPASPQDAKHDRDHDHAHDPDEARPSHRSDHRADDVFESWSWSAERALDRETIERLMADLPETVVRAKGVLWIEGEPDRPMILQRVGRRWTLRRGRAETGPRPSRLVIIGMAGAIDDSWLAERLSR